MNDAPEIRWRALVVSKANMAKAGVRFVSAPTKEAARQQIEKADPTITVMSVVPSVRDP